MEVTNKRVTGRSPLPLWFRWFFVAFMVVYVPAYWIGYGLSNFLWLSNVTLMLAFLATVFQSRFLASMAAVAGLMPEVLWSIDFVFVLFGGELTGFADYVFDPDLPAVLRAIALFHLALPPLLVWLVVRLGYDRQAWLVAIPFGWALLLFTWLVTDPALNINLVFSYRKFDGLNVGAASNVILLSLILGASVVITHGVFRVTTARK